MNDIGKAIGILALILAVFPHEIDGKERDSDCIKLCENCKQLGGDKSPTGKHSYCFNCPLYVYSFIVNEEE